MKAILVLLACLTINILEADSKKCVPKQLRHINLECLQGTWYLNYASPNVFTGLTNISEILHLDGNKYVGNITVTPYTKNVSETHNLLVNLDDTRWDIHAENLEQFESVFNITATDYNYIIKHGRPSATAPEELDIISFTKRCPDSSTVEAAKQAVRDLCLNWNDFHEDPSLSTVCPE